MLASLNEILKEVRRIEIATKRSVTSTFSGFYNSAFRGSGMQFSDTRPYVPGDDVRHIAWNLTARTNVPHIKQYQEERELNIILAVDASASRIFGGERASVGRRLVQLAATLGFAALQNNDLVGAFIFTDKVEKNLVPKKGHDHVLRLIRDLIAFEPKNTRTAMDDLCRHILKNLRRRSVIFIISDFIVALPPKQLLKQCASRHEIVALQVSDPFEGFLPTGGLVSVRDSETGAHRILDLGLPGARRNLEGKIKLHREYIHRTLLQCGIEHLVLDQPEVDINRLTRFFMERKTYRATPVSPSGIVT